MKAPQLQQGTSSSSNSNTFTPSSNSLELRRGDILASSKGEPLDLRDSGAESRHLCPQGPWCPLLGRPHLVHVRGLVPVGRGGDITGTVGETAAGVATGGELWEGACVATGAVARGAGGLGVAKWGFGAGAGRDIGAGGAEAALLAAWYLAARRRFFSLCTGPRWRGRFGRGGGW